MSGFLWRMGGAVALGVLGLTLVFWQLEHTALYAYAGLGRPEAGVYALLFAGLLLLNLALFYALTRWSRFIHTHPETRQLPVWFLVLLIMFAGAALVTGIAVHATYMRSLDPVPMDISQGFIAYEVSFAALALVPLVLLAVRWSTGYRRG